jgi:parallel beta-helix repeat protein
MRLDMLAPITAGNDSVNMRCNATLQAGDRVARQLFFTGDAADGVTLDCQGASLDAGAGSRCVGGTNAGAACNPATAGQCGEGVCTLARAKNMIEIRSVVSDERDANGFYVRQRPEDITVKNCTILGTVDVTAKRSRAKNAASSHDLRAPGHPARMRDAAPTRITFDNVTITTAAGETALYLRTGTSRVTLKNSRINGAGMGIYLTAETQGNVIRNNRFSVRSGREHIAIDGSSWNVVAGNTFENIDHGGIHLYRNCGQDETTRYDPPEHNNIINNTFKYTASSDTKAGIGLGTREGRDPAAAPYCDDDDDPTIPGTTSATDDRDFARHNAVMQNRFIGRSPTTAIQQGTVASNSAGTTSSKPNHVNINEQVTSAPSRRSGCFVEPLIDPFDTGRFLLDGQQLTTAAGTIACQRFTCTDGLATFVYCAP